MEDWQEVVDKIIVPAKQFPDKRCDFVIFFAEQLSPIIKFLNAAICEEIKKFRENQISLNVLEENILSSFRPKIAGLDTLSLSFLFIIGVEVGIPTYDNKNKF